MLQSFTRLWYLNKKIFLLYFTCHIYQGSFCHVSSGKFLTFCNLWHNFYMFLDIREHRSDFFFFFTIFLDNMVTRDTWHVTRDMWHMTHDTYCGMNILAKFQLSSFSGSGLTVLWIYFHKTWLTFLIVTLVNCKAVYRTDPATQGLLMT